MAIAEELAALRERTLAEIAAADTSAALEAVRVAVLGKSGTLTGYLRSMGQVPAEERASVGKAVNAARVEVEEALAARKAALDAAELEAAMGAAAVDVTLPGRAQQVGTRHLINGIIDEVSDIFLGLGYKVVEGEEIETDYYNFTALNAPADHPVSYTHLDVYKRQHLRRWPVAHDPGTARRAEGERRRGDVLHDRRADFR